jgi:hypothetical protein
MGGHNMAEIVYAAINSRIMDIKIGKTDKENVEERLKELYTTGVAVPFDCAYACIVEDNEAVEKFMHEKFEKYRVTPRREFFKIKSQTAIKALKPYELEDVTPQTRKILDSTLSKQEKADRWQARQEREKKNPKWRELKDLHEKFTV